MSDWKDAVVRITANNPKQGEFGSGFVFHRDAAGRSFVMTCRHVVDDVARDSGDDESVLLADGHAAEVLARGDSVLDLAILSVEDLRAPALTLAGSPARVGSAFDAAGYSWMESAAQSTVRRPISGRLRGRNPVSPLWGPALKVWYWDVEIAEDLFRELKKGYSGSPVVDPDTRQVVAILNLKRDSRRAHALCIEAHRLFGDTLLQHLPGFRAGGLSDTGAAGERRGEAAAPGAVSDSGPRAPPAAAAHLGHLDWLAGLLDHEAPLSELEAWLVDDHGPSFRFCVVDAGAEDYPRALAIHLAAHAGDYSRRLLQHKQLITDLVLYTTTPAAVWLELARALADPDDTPEPAARAVEDSILRWIGEPSPARRRLKIIYAELDKNRGRQLATLIGGTIERFSHLEADAEGRVLFLFGLVETPRTPWLRLRFGRTLPPLAGCDHLGALKPLTWHDQEQWLRRLETGSVRLADESLERVRAVLRMLFPRQTSTARYRVVWDALTPQLRAARTAFDPGTE